jgi:peroxiredoxin
LAFALAGALVLAGEGVAAPAPDFTVSLSDSSTFHLEDHRGSVVVLLFMYLYAPGMGSLEPSLRTVYLEFSNDATDASGFAMLSIDILPSHIHTLAQIEDYRQALGIPWPMGSDNAGTESVAQAYGVTEVPTLFVVDPGRNITWQRTHRVGENPNQTAAELRQEIRDAFPRPVATPVPVPAILIVAVIGVVVIAAVAAVLIVLIARRSRTRPPA